MAESPPYYFPLYGTTTSLFNLLDKSDWIVKFAMTGKGTFSRTVNVISSFHEFTPANFTDGRCGTHKSRFLTAFRNPGRLRTDRLSTTLYRQNIILYLPRTHSRREKNFETTTAITYKSCLFINLTSLAGNVRPIVTLLALYTIFAI
jgi:hypothetical protein